MKSLNIALLLSLGLALAPIAFSTAKTAPGELANGTGSTSKQDSLFIKGVEHLKMFHLDRAIADFIPYSLSAAGKPLSEKTNRKRLAHKLMWIARAFSFDENDRAAAQLLAIACQLDPDNIYIKCFLADAYAQSAQYEKCEAVEATLKPFANTDIFVCRSLAAHCNRRKDPLGALAWLEKAQKLPESKDSAYLAWIRAGTMNALGATPEAVQWYRKAETKSDNPYTKKIFRAQAFVLEQKFDEAACALQEAGELNPDDPSWHSILAGVYWFQNKVEDARNEVLKALQCRRAASNVHVSASRFFAANDHTKRNAFRALDHIERLIPSRGTILGQRARLYLSTKEPDKARAEFKRQIAIDKYWVDGYFELANIELTAGKNEEALEWSSKATELFPTNRLVWIHMGGVMRKMEHPKEASEAYLKALSLMVKPFDRLNVIAKNEVATVYAHTGSWEYSQAKTVEAEIAKVTDEEFRKFGSKHKPSPELEALMKKRTELEEKALAAAKMFNQYKFNPDLPAHLKWVKLRPGRVAFTSKDTNNLASNSHCVLADMLFETNYVKDAIAEYRKAIEISPDDIDLHGFLFQALQKDGNWLEAAKEDVIISQKIVNRIPSAVGLK